MRWFEAVLVDDVLDGLSGGDGFQLLVRPRKRGTFCVLAAKFMILSRSARGRSTSLVSLETLREAGEFSIQVPPRILESVLLSFP